MKGDYMEYIVFNHSTIDDELIEKFNDTIDRLELDSLFTDEHRSSEIKVDYLDLKSVVNKTGASVSRLEQFSTNIKKSDDNKMYASVMLRTLNQPKTFKQFMKIIKEVNEYIETVKEEHMFNVWNIVWYNEELY